MLDEAALAEASTFKQCDHCGRTFARNFKTMADDAVWAARLHCSGGCTEAAGRLAEAVRTHAACQWCGGPVEHRQGEAIQAYRARKCCSGQCGDHLRAQRAAERHHTKQGDSWYGREWPVGDPLGHALRKAGLPRYDDHPDAFTRDFRRMPLPPEVRRSTTGNAAAMCAEMRGSLGAVTNAGGFTVRAPR